MQEELKANQVKLTKLEQDNQKLVKDNNDYLKANSLLSSKIIQKQEVQKTNTDDDGVDLNELKDKAINTIIAKANRDKTTERKLSQEIKKSIDNMEE